MKKENEKIQENSFFGLRQTMFASEQDIWDYFKKTPGLYNQVSSMRSAWQKQLFDYMLGKKTLPVTYDPFFKRIFNADIHPERLSRFLSAMLGNEVTVERVLPSEEVMIDGGALLVMDILVRLNDGSLANVEIQKMPFYFPGERMSCYSADLLLREYSRVKGEVGERFSYRDMKKVYTIVIFESSTAAFHDEILAGEYFHHGKTIFHSGLKMDLLQEYYLVVLDVFRNVTYHRDRNERNGWLSLLAVENMDEVEKNIQDYPWLAKIYEEMAEYLHKPEEVVGMYSEALRILDRNTVNLMIDDMKEQIESQKEELKTQKEELKIQKEELEQERLRNSQKDEELEQQREKIAKQEQELERLNRLLEKRNS